MMPEASTVDHLKRAIASAGGPRESDQQLILPYPHMFFDSGPLSKYTRSTLAVVYMSAAEVQAQRQRIRDAFHQSDARRGLTIGEVCNALETLDFRPKKGAWDQILPMLEDS